MQDQDPQHSSQPPLAIEQDSDQSYLQVPGSTDDQGTPAQRASRKREREASIEPQTVKDDAPSNEDDLIADPSERKTIPVPKRNRLDRVDELESPPLPGSPALDLSQPRPTAPATGESPPNTPPRGNASPPMSAKTSIQDESTQHIRKRVKEMTWKDSASPVRGGAAAARPKSIYDTTMQDAQEAEDEIALQDEDHSVGEVLLDHQNASASAPAPAQNEDTVIPDAKPQPHPDIEETDAAISAPPPDVPSENSALAPALELSPTLPNASEEQRLRTNSDSDPDLASEDLDNISKSPSRKRKLVSRESNFANDSRRHHEEFSKRVRDEDGEPKTVVPETVEEVQERPATPPPKEKEVGEANEVSPMPLSTPKSVAGFSSFSGVSPLAKIGGATTSKPVAPQPTKSFASGFGSFIANSSPFAAVASSVPSIFGSSAAPAPKRATSPEPVSTAPISFKSSHPKSPTPPDNNRSRSPSVSSLNRRKSPPPAGTKPKPGAAFGSYNNANFGFGSVPTTSSFGAFGSSAGATRHSPSPSLDGFPSRKASVQLDDKDDGTPPPQSQTPNDLPLPRTSGEGMKRGASWGEMLGAAGGEAVSDDEGKEKKKPKVEVIEVLTGEENEDTRYSVRAKLYVLDAHNAYKERGLGLLKINVRKEDGSGARLVMRADAVHRLILNAALFNGMSVTTGPDPKYIKLASMEGGKAVNYAIRLGTPKAAQDLYDKIQDYIPTVRGVSTPPPAEV